MQYSTNEETEQDGIFHPKPFQVQGLCLGHKQVEPKVVSPQRQSALVGARVCQPMEGGPVENYQSRTRSRTHTCTHTHTCMVGTNLQPHIYLAHCLCDSLRF